MDIRIIIRAFEDKQYAVQYFETAQEATSYLCAEIRGKTVGLGDSQTLKTMGILEKLSLENEVFDPAQAQSNEDFIKTAKRCLTAERFITSVNAFSASGELVNIDGTGNRIAGSLFGHKKVTFVMGTNKGVQTLEKAIWRARNIAAPKNAKRLGKKTPCAIKGDKCYDCSSSDRICNALTVHYKAMSNTQSEIIFINQDLGY